MGEDARERGIVWLPGVIDGKGQNHKRLAPLQIGLR